MNQPKTQREVNEVSCVHFHTWQPNDAAKSLATNCRISHLYTHTYSGMTQGFHGTHPMVLANCYTLNVLNEKLVRLSFIITLFPHSPRMQTKNQKERGEPGKIYQTRNVIGGEKLITCV